MRNIRNLRWHNVQARRRANNLSQGLPAPVSQFEQETSPST